MNGDGFISMSEFFIYALEEALSHSSGAGSRKSAGLGTFIARFDVEGDGELSREEFTRMAERLGFGNAANEILAEIDDNGSGGLTLEELPM